MSLEPGRSYLITPKDSSLDKEGLGVGPVPLIYPPIDVPVRLLQVNLRDRWLLIPAQPGDGGFNVYSGKGQPNDYKWIKNDDSVLYVTGTQAPGSFRFDPAGPGLFLIGIPNEDLVLTLNRELDPPQFTFKPADGSDAQRFQVVAIERD